MASLHTLPKFLGSNVDRICLWKSIVDETLKWVLLDFVQLHCLHIGAIHFDKIGEEAYIEQWHWNKHVEAYSENVIQLSAVLYLGLKDYFKLKVCPANYFVYQITLFKTPLSYHWQCCKRLFIWSLSGSPQGAIPNIMRSTQR